jgi:hypothetical protein
MPPLEPDAPTLDDALAELSAGRRLRDEGAAAAEASLATAWRLAAEAALDRLIASGRHFTAEDVYRLAGEPLGGHRNGTGGLFLRASKAGRIVPVGVAQATRRERRGGILRVWRGVS